jgi:polynucleotide 5'-kinase involved in rRNA processing
MISDIKQGNTLLVKGPTRITVLKGKIEVMGKIILPEAGDSSMESSEFDDLNVLIIPEANTYPLYALENSELEIYTNKPDENLKVIEENSISDRWIEIKNILLKELKSERKTPLKIMCLGISCGKTTLIKYLANNFIREGFKGGYLDSDLGQQIMYLPTTLNLGEIKDSIISGEDIDTESTVFIGATFPKGNYKFIVSRSCRDLIDKYIKNHDDTDFLLIDTDGWIKQEAGVIYKNFFIKTVDPEVVVIFHDESIEELKIIEKAAKSRKDRKLYLIEESNKFFYEKDKEERRFLRQSQFAKVLEGYRKISIPISKNDIKFVKKEYDLESNEIFEQQININDLINLPYHYVIISLLDENSEMIKIGLLFVINVQKDYILIFSDLTYKEQVRIKKISLGSLRLSTKGNHQGYLYL